MPRPITGPTNRGVPNVSPSQSTHTVQACLTFILRHQWIFVTDTVDAIYRPDNWFPEAMMDQLAEIAGALPVGVCLLLSYDCVSLTYVHRFRMVRTEL